MTGQGFCFWYLWFSLRSYIDANGWDLNTVLWKEMNYSSLKNIFAAHVLNSYSEISIEGAIGSIVCQTIFVIKKATKWTRYHMTTKVVKYKASYLNLYLFGFVYLKQSAYQANLYFHLFLGASVHDSTANSWHSRQRRASLSGKTTSCRQTQAGICVFAASSEVHNWSV